MRVKRIAVILLTLVLVLGAAVGAAAAEAALQEDSDVSYQLTDGVLTVSGSGTISSVSIPGGTDMVTSIVVEEGITGLGSGVFRDLGNLSSVTLPASLTEIGSNAFYGCKALTDAFYGGTLAQFTGITVSSGNLPLKETALKHCQDGDARLLGACGEGLTWVYDGAGTLLISGSGAMEDYANNSNVPWSKAAAEITAVQLQEGLTRIGNHAFDCCAMEEITVPEGVETIGEYAFNNCAALERVSLPASLREIGGRAFYGCAALENIRLPLSLTAIGDYAFNGCSALTEVSYAGEILDWVKISMGSNTVLNTVPKLCGAEQKKWLGAGPCGAEGYELFWMMDAEYNLTILGEGPMKEMRDFRYNTNIPWKGAKTVTLAEGVTGVSRYAFSDFTQLTEAVLPESLTELGEEAFANTGLTGIRIPGGVKDLTVVFDGCSALTEATLAEGTETLSGTFRNCAALTTLSLPSTLTGIGFNSFYGCDALTDIHYGGTWEQWQAISIDSYNIPLGMAVKHCADRSLIVTGTSGDGLSWELDGEGTLTVSGVGSMDYTPGWNGYRARIRRAVLQEGVTDISQNSFNKCENLTEIRVPASVSKIGDIAFTDSTALLRIDVAEGNENYWSRDGVLYGPCSDYDSSPALRCYPAGRTEGSFTVPEGVLAIGRYAFSECAFLEELILPTGVTKLDSDSIRDCPALRAVTVPHTVTNIGRNHVLDNCPALTVRGYDDSPIEAFAREQELPWESLGSIPYTVIYIDFETSEDPAAELKEAVRQKYTHIILGDGIYDTGRLNLSSYLTIEAKHPGKVEILSSDGRAPVVSTGGMGTKQVELRGLILGHSVESGYEMSCAGPGGPGSAGGDVIYASGVDGLIVENCDLWGCGIVAIRMYDCTGVEVRDSILRDCVESAVVSSGCEARFENCIFSGNAYSNQSFDCLRLSGDLTELEFRDCLFFNNRNPALTSAAVPEDFFGSCVFHDNAWQGQTPGTYGICLGGVTWQAAETESGYRLRFGGDIPCGDGAVLPGRSGEVPDYSRYSKPWKRIIGLQEGDVASAPGTTVRVPAGTERCTLRVDNTGLTPGRRYSVYYALYRENGQMFGLHREQITVSGEFSSELLLEGQPAGTVCRIFLLEDEVPRTEPIRVLFED